MEGGGGGLQGPLPTSLLLLLHRQGGSCCSPPTPTPRLQKPGAANQFLMILFLPLMCGLILLQRTCNLVTNNPGHGVGRTDTEESVFEPELPISHLSFGNSLR